MRRLSSTAQYATRVLENPKIDLPKPPLKPKDETKGMLVETLVVYGLRLADETDPLKRAEVCTDVADCLIETIVEESKKGENADEMVRLGAYLGAIRNHAIEPNLGNVNVNQGDVERRKEYDRIKLRVEENLKELNRKLNAASSPECQQRIDKAIQASHYPSQDKGQSPQGFYRGGKDRGGDHAGFRDKGGFDKGPGDKGSFDRGPFDKGSFPKGPGKDRRRD
jgi:hypothetical protein